MESLVSRNVTIGEALAFFQGELERRIPMAERALELGLDTGLDVGEYLVALTETVEGLKKLRVLMKRADRLLEEMRKSPQGP